MGTTMCAWMKRVGFLAVVFAMALGAATVSAVAQDDADYDDHYYASGAVNDPLEPMNRGIHTFNKVLDSVLFEPVARSYVFVVPEFGRDRVHNAVNNLYEPVNMLNGFIQLNPQRGFTSMWRFILNSTLGVLGLFDFAGYNAGLHYVEEDFGQSLGYYGWGSGPYIVLPILGPSNLRDAIGRVIDVVSNPFNYSKSDTFVYTRWGVSVLDARSRNLELVDDIYRNSLDPYATFRSAYSQRRNALIRNNEPREPSVSTR